MKKLFKTLVCLTLALVMCFGLTACGEFSGDFKTVASADEINTTFTKVEQADGKADTETGYQLKATFKGAFENEAGKGNIDMSMKGKISIKDGVKSSIESKMTFSGSSSIGETSISFESASDVAVYTGDGAMYTNMVISVNGTETDNSKTKMNFGTDLQSAIDNFADMVAEGAEGFDFFSMTSAQLESEGIKVYIDSSDKGTKIKFEFDDTSKGDNSVFGKGTAIYSFGANNLLRGYRMEYELQGLKVFVELKPYSGSVKLPSDLDTYKG